ncbi:SigE family RNA polymerase sigma factor [Dactylosporangium fulvum]|uniref:SigE family RNA polymerase sigma factor n=1 Tax=Dactylosporangium fulvum TaxID=53359 RepID=A0ABY5W2S7_9ACTN|nr:SigE family RNA polymerase sigma factor [Dactylosporangium fulvum]UWP83675.1 SigE family RNA polymerase sigma factor [Dactylosporangium fulvum]
MHIDFAEFVVSRTAALLRFGYLLTGDRHLAEDLTQEALVKAHRRWGGIVGDAGPEPYVRQAILRQFLSWRRRRSFTERPIAEPPDVPLAGDLSDRLADADEMWSLLRTLPRSQRAVIVLRYYEDLPDAEIARLLGCSPATVRVHAFHALQRLRAALTPVRLPGGQT